jgi:hypothetical protein
VKGVSLGSGSWPEFLAFERESGAPIADALLVVRRWLAHLPAERIHIVTVLPVGTDPAVLLGRFADALTMRTSDRALEEESRLDLPGRDEAGPPGYSQ